jgi:polyhydroxyalkanoate synthesis regulator phasin
MIDGDINERTSDADQAGSEWPMSDNNQGMTAERLNSLLRKCSMHSSHRLHPEEHHELVDYVIGLRAENEELRNNAVKVLVPKALTQYECELHVLREEIEELKRQLNDIRHPPARMPSGEILDQGRYL